MKRDTAALGTEQFELLVCGGGIYGAWTAYDAALRGLKVALIERGDWACATSSASSKLIHGGLRYLESFDFKLVKKALNERGMLLRTAPHRVWPLRFGVPVYADSRISRLKLKAGLMLYDGLAGIPDPAMKHHYWGAAAFARHFPKLAETGLRGGFTYADAQTDDARLVLELVAGAQEAGALCLNYCALIAHEKSAGKLSGASVSDRLNGKQLQVRAQVIVSTAGQWLVGTEQGHDWCRLSKGIHLLLPDIGLQEALLLTARSDGRVFFIIPWYGITLVGTTDTNYSGDIEQVVVAPGEVDYLLSETNHYLSTRWTTGDVIGSYAGLRVMRKSDDDSPSAVSRDWELKTNEDGVFYSIGGKLTSAREDAAVIVDAVCDRLGKAVPCRTLGRNFPWTPPDFTAWSMALAERAGQLGIDAECSKWLIRRHGKRAEEIICDVANNGALAKRIVPTLPFIYADLLFCAREEMVEHLDDLLRRRMPLLILAKLGKTELRAIAGAVSGILAWDTGRVEQELSRVTARMGNQPGDERLQP